MIHYFQVFFLLSFEFSWLNKNLIIQEHFKVLVKGRPKWQHISGTTLISTIIHKLFHSSRRLAIGVKWLLFVCTVFFVLLFMGLAAIVFELIRCDVSESNCVTCTNYMHCWNRHFIIQCFYTSLKPHHFLALFHYEYKQVFTGLYF